MEGIINANAQIRGIFQLNSIVVGYDGGEEEEERGAYRVLVGRREGKRPLGRRRHRWEENITMDLGEIGIDGANWIRLPQDRI
jgi:hypothetical protein